MHHLSGFYFISAQDVEARVLPMLDVLNKETDHKLRCHTASSNATKHPEADDLAACCKLYNASEASTSTACYVGQVKGAPKVSSLGGYCTSHTQHTAFFARYAQCSH